MQRKDVIRTLAVLAAFAWLAGYIGFAVSVLSMRAPRGAHTTDAIIVLTGGNSRIETGLELFARGRARHLFITGVHPGVAKEEITGMWRGETALPPCCITLGHEAVSTVENAREARDWMRAENYSSLRLVTANYHMDRSLLEFRHALPDAAIIPHPVRPHDFNPRTKGFWLLTFNEYNKTLLRRAVLLGGSDSE